MADPRALVDAGPLIRLAVANDPLHDQVVATIERLIQEGFEFCFAPQAIREGWNVLTRPVDARGYGYSPRGAAIALQGI